MIAKVSLSLILVFSFLGSLVNATEEADYFASIRIGMDGDEAETKLGKPVLKNGEVWKFISTPHETVFVLKFKKKKLVTYSIHFRGPVEMDKYLSVDTKLAPIIADTYSDAISENKLLANSKKQTAWEINPNRKLVAIYYLGNWKPSEPEILRDKAIEKTLTKGSNR